MFALLINACGDPSKNYRFTAPDLPSGIVATGAEWEILRENELIYADSPVVDADGNLYYAATIERTLYKQDSNGNTTVFDKDTAMTMGLVVSDDNILYGCRNLDGQIVRYGWDGEYDVLLQGEVTPRKERQSSFIPGEFCNDLAVNPAGGLWFTDRINRKIYFLDTDGNARVVADGFRANGIHLSKDKSMLFFGDSDKPELHAYAIGVNGALDELPGFFEPLLMGKRRINPDYIPGTNGMTMDGLGRLYVATFYGIQVFNIEGVLIGRVPLPGVGFVSNLGFAGSENKTLYATGRGFIARLQMDVVGKPWPVAAK